MDERMDEEGRETDEEALVEELVDSLAGGERVREASEDERGAEEELVGRDEGREGIENVKD